MTTPGAMNSLLERLRNKIEDADNDVNRSEYNFNGYEDENYAAGYDAGYAEALRELWADITGDAFPRTRCETVPVQQSGQATAEHGGGGADPILQEAAAPTLGIEVELRRRWKQYRDNAVSNEFCNTEQIAFGGRAGGLLEAINLIEAIPLSDAELSTAATL